MCVAIDSQGDVVSTAEPTGPAGAWDIFVLLPSSALDAVSCPAASLCVAVGWAGTIATSTHPLGGRRAWMQRRLADPNDLTDVSCPSPSRCAVVDDDGRIIFGTAVHRSPRAAVHASSSRSAETV